MSYRRIPSLPETGEVETVAQRGARIVRWILETGVTVTLSELDLERADVAVGYAVARAADEDIRQTLTDTRHAILATLRIRRAVDKAEQAEPVPSCAERPNVGPMAPLQPAPIVRPPAPVEVEIGF